jgi:hypothetical protein
MSHLVTKVCPPDAILPSKGNVGFFSGAWYAAQPLPSHRPRDRNAWDTRVVPQRPPGIAPSSGTPGVGRVNPYEEEAERVAARIARTLEAECRREERKHGGDCSFFISTTIIVP